MLTQDIEKLKQAFEDQEFSGNDIARVLELSSYHGAGWRIKFMASRGLIHKTPHGYRFGAPPEAAPTTVKTFTPTVAAPIVPSELLCSPPSVVRIGELYLHERLLLIADTARQEASDALRIYTTIIEIDPASKHPRNKIVNFIKARDPREYAQARAWLDVLAGMPPNADDTALELATELESKLNAAKKEIAELRAKLDAIRGMIRGEA